MAYETPLQRLSRRLNIVCLVLMVLLPLVNLLIWIQWESWGRDIIVHRVGLHTMDSSRIPQELSLLQLLLGISITAVPVGILILGLVYLRRLFRAFAEGVVFTVYNARAIRVFAWSVVAIQIIGFFTNGIESLIITMNNAPGQKALALHLSSNHVMWLFVGLVFVVIAHALEEGHRLADDSASII